MQSTNGNWAVVTGASSGLGVEFAKILAARKINLVLTARSEAPMQKLASELISTHGIQVSVIASDLAKPGSATALRNRIDDQNIQPEILINNAGYGFSGSFQLQSVEALNTMLQLDIISLTELTHLFGERMKTAKRGHIMLVSSMAAHQPVPMLAAYSASKAYVLSLGEALHVEFAPDVNVTTLIPGLLNTGFAHAANYTAPKAALSSVIPTAEAAQIGIDAMFARKPSVIAGTMNKIMATMVPFVPRSTAAKIAFDMAKK
ncbi:MAG: SDR family NAD(P)-dependent oxidoreductase [Candidatus Obscuribacterales bacterium]|nr:SDR family NAD(P)-dependent oxidoreductase [Candidatus Obscuribacterales bacterium]